MNHALYATRLNDENRTEATRIQLDAQGNVTNPLNDWGHAWSQGAINYAQDRRSYAVYSEAMKVLDSVIGEDNDTATVNTYNHTLGKFESVAYAESMIEKLQQAALNGSQAALIAYTAASIYINKYAYVDFSWYFTTEEVTTVPAPASPVVAHDTQEPTLTLVDAKGRTLTATATGWQAESASQPGDVHKVSPSGSSCTCLGFTYHSKCWHTSLIRSLHTQPTNEEPSFLDVEYQL